MRRMTIDRDEVKEVKIKIFNRSFVEKNEDFDENAKHKRLSVSRLGERSS